MLALESPGFPSWIGTALLTLSLIAGSSGAVDPAVKSAEGWELATQDGDIRVYRRLLPESDIVETYSVAEIAATPLQVLAVITDYPNYPNFMPHMIESRVISQKGEQQLLFQRLRISNVFRFLIKDRYHVVQNRIVVPSGVQKNYRVEWALDTAATQEFKVDDAVPTRMNSGYWELESINEGTATGLKYYLRADPGGAIPKSFANAGTVQSIPAVINAIRGRVSAAAKPATPAQ